MSWHLPHWMPVWRTWHIGNRKCRVAWHFAPSTRTRFFYPFRTVKNSSGANHGYFSMFACCEFERSLGADGIVSPSRLSAHSKPTIIVASSACNGSRCISEVLVNNEKKMKWKRVHSHACRKSVYVMNEKISRGRLLSGLDVVEHNLSIIGNWVKCTWSVDDGRSG